jgi:hypothetical protein
LFRYYKKKKKKILTFIQQYSLGAARFKAFEVLFQPEYIGLDCMGLAEACHLAVSLSSDSIEKRFALWDSVVVAGGPTGVKGMFCSFFLVGGGLTFIYSLDCMCNCSFGRMLLHEH